LVGEDVKPNWRLPAQGEREIESKREKKRERDKESRPSQNCMSRARPVQTAHQKHLLDAADQAPTAPGGFRV